MDQGSQPGRSTGQWMNRRNFLKCATASLATAGIIRSGLAATPSDSILETAKADEDILKRIEAHRPSRLDRLPARFRERVGATHVAGKYHLTGNPFLLEGAKKLLELGTRLGKFWFIPDTIQGSYPFNSQWGKYKHFVELARSDYFQQLFEMPFETVILEAHTPFENSWRRAGLPDEFYQTITQEFYDLTAHLYRIYRDRPVTVILQHWEGDWLLRGRGGERWDPPPNDWRERCERMQRWLAARQKGVTKARAEHGQNAKCRVAHAAEVNRVADAWKGIPTMTRHVLPSVELDLVSYSCYDGMTDPLTLWKCIEEIHQHAKTGRSLVQARSSRGRLASRRTSSRNVFPNDGINGWACSSPRM
jgi:hypothetical protein